MPTPVPTTTTLAPGSIATVLPQVTPVVATAQAAPEATVISSPAANIQAAAPSPTTPDAGTFTVNIGMSAQTAQTLGAILLALCVTLVASRLINRYFSRTRQTSATRTFRFPALRIPWSRLRLPRFRLRADTGKGGLAEAPAPVMKDAVRLSHDD